MGLSIRAYAKHRGVSHVAVKKAIDTGRITPEADGTIDPIRADREWTQNTPSGRKPTQIETKPAVVETTSIQPPEPAAPTLSSGGTSLLQARTVNEVVKAQTNRLRLEQLRGDVVDRNQVIAHVFRLAREERDAWLNWPARISAQLAAQLGVDGHTLHVLLEQAVRDHLKELGEINPRID